MKSIIIACCSIELELQAILKQHHSDMIVYWLDPELHVNTDLMKKQIQTIIDRQEDVDRIYICVSGCGCAGATEGLVATTADLYFPRTKDCIDLLLSKDSAEFINRPYDNGIFLTESWLQYMRNTYLDYRYLERTKGEEEAYDFVRSLFKNIKNFYIVDTCCSNTFKVYKFLQPLLEVLDKATFKRIQGSCGLLHKIAEQDMDYDNFIKVPKGKIKA